LHIEDELTITGQRSGSSKAEHDEEAAVEDLPRKVVKTTRRKAR